MNILHQNVKKLSNSLLILIILTDLLDAPAAIRAEHLFILTMMKLVNRLKCLYQMSNKCRFGD